MSTKASATLLASTSVAAGATASSTTLNLATGYGALLLGSIANGATAPTTPCAATCQVTDAAGTTFDVLQVATASAAASAVTPFVFDIPIHAIQARVSFSGHTGQAVTCICRAQYTTAL